MQALDTYFLNSKHVPTQSVLGRRFWYEDTLKVPILFLKEHFSLVCF